MRIVIAGGSGFLGRHLAHRYRRAGHDVVILTRRTDRTLDLPQVEWDAASLGPWVSVLSCAEPVALINLSGKLVDCRPTAKNIALLASSRVDATQILVKASQTLDRPVDRWLQASTTAIYSHVDHERLDEFSPIPDPGLAQMTGVARAWEQASEAANASRKTVLRTSIVLAEGCPAWERLATIVRWGAGGRIGSGQQGFSWIHLNDWLRIADLALGLGEGITLPDGVLIAASPNPVSNGELMSLLRRHLHRPGVPSPATLIRVGAMIMGTDPALALTGRYATSTILSRAGFAFEFPDLESTIIDLTHDDTRRGRR